MIHTYDTPYRQRREPTFELKFKAMLYHFGSTRVFVRNQDGGEMVPTTSERRGPLGLLISLPRIGGVSFRSSIMSFLMGKGRNHGRRTRPNSGGSLRQSRVRGAPQAAKSHQSKGGGQVLLQRPSQQTKMQNEKQEIDLRTLGIISMDEGTSRLY